MNSKKSLITIVIIIVVLIVGGLLWRGGLFGNKVEEGADSVLPTDETSTTEMGAQTGGQTTGDQTGNVEKINDDIYVELMAQTAYLSQKSPATYVSEMKKLYSKYDVTEESFTAFGDELGKDPVRTQEIVQKYTKRLQELMK